MLYVELFSRCAGDVVWSLSFVGLQHSNWPDSVHPMAREPVGHHLFILKLKPAPGEYRPDPPRMIVSFEHT